MIIRCTKKILDKLKINDPPQADDTPSIYSWHANILKYGRRDILLIFNDASGISVICDRPKIADLRRMGEILEEGVRKLMTEMGIREDVIRKYLEDSGETVITRTNNRSVLSRMVQYSYYIEANIYNLNEDALVQLPMMVDGLDYIFSEKGGFFVPSERFAECLEAKYGPHIV
ncbi:MAG: hypothetical protein K5653_02110 [Clostridiales bacterium]|nr:hypothetical protein [Clostridiales bacterium]